MRVLLTTALIIWPSFALAQIGNRTTKNDDLVSNSRLGKLAKKISNENAAAADAQFSQIQSSGQTQGQGLGQTGLQNYSLSTATTNPSPSLSSKGLGSGAYDLSAGRDIAGVTIGMSPDQVKRTLTAKGYLLDATDNHPSFEELVKITREDISRHDQRSFKGAIGTLEFKKGVFEEISVTFMSMPGHPIASKVLYENRDSSLTGNKIRHLLLDKYGPDPERKSRLAKVAKLQTRGGGYKHALKIEQDRLDTQKYFKWSNPDKNTQILNASVSHIDGGNTNSHRDVSFYLVLKGGRDLEILQQEQIRSRLGASTTTF